MLNPTKTVSRFIRVILIMLMMTLLLATGCSTDGKTPSDSAGNSGQASQTAIIDTEGAIHIQIDIKDYGLVKADLYPGVAPETVKNFVKLVEAGFYDGLTFHRVINDFMIQGGDPLGTGRGGSDATIIGEFSNNNIANGLSHTRGVLSMARAGNDNNSASSQFFIVQKDVSQLDGDYAAFGMVTEGLDVVDAIAADTPVEDDNGTVKPENQPVINTITILE